MKPSTTSLIHHSKAVSLDFMPRLHVLLPQPSFYKMYRTKHLMVEACSIGLLAKKSFAMFLSVQWQERCMGSLDLVVQGNQLSRTFYCEENLLGKYLAPLWLIKSPNNRFQNFGTIKM
eukprot:Lithocolla_globosa_v1_NODE_269_length_4740_cov_54.506510.p3 type:complete len:118 gc:universal NODE_269_length_4740_cov_54.506510:2324-1971(-)